MTTKVLLINEMGGGLGHILPLANLAKDYLDAGAIVFLAVRNIYEPIRAKIDPRIQVIQLPTPPLKNFSATPATTLAEILFNKGLAYPEILDPLLNAWRTILDIINPQIIAFDYSPVAMLAAENYPALKIIHSSPFCVPAGINKALTKTQSNGEKTIADSNEIDLINNFNRNRKKPLKLLSDIFDADVINILGVAKLDIYKDDRKAGAFYVNVPPPKMSFKKAKWPSVGLKVFVYLKPFAKNSSPILQTLKKLTDNLIVFNGENDPLDMNDILATADAVVCHGGNGLANQALSVNIPLLLAPTNLEELQIALLAEKQNLATVIYSDTDSAGIFDSVNGFVAGI